MMEKAEMERLLFNHRIDEIVEMLKRLYESTIGSRYWTWEYTKPWTLPAGSEKPFLTLSHGSGLYHCIAKIKMPDSTAPENIYFVIEVDDLKTGARKYVHEGDSPKELYDMGFTAPNTYGYVTIYDTTNLLYAWVWPLKLNFTTEEKATVKLNNRTAKDITVQNIYIDGYVRPYGRYIREFR